MIKKGLFILCTYFVLSLISACCNLSEPYFKFDSAFVEHSIWRDENNLTVGTQFKIILTNLEYVASNSLFQTAAFAMQPCEGPGSSGPKSPITKIDVSVNQSYFDTIPKNSNINNLFYARYFDSNDNTKLSEYDGSFYNQDRYVNPNLNALYIHKNNLDTSHVFKFEIYQENGKKTTIFSNAVNW